MLIVLSHNLDMFGLWLFLNNKIPMKRLLKYMVILFCIVLSLESCSEKKIIIGVSQCCGGLWREKVNQEMRLALYQYKDIHLLFTTAENDGQRQARQIDSMIARKVDLIVVAPDNVNDVTPAIERAYRAHIPVILFDRKVKTSHYTASIGGDNVEAGREVALFMAKKLGGKGTVVEITGLKDASPVIERHRGFHEVMKNYPGIKVVTLDSNWKMERAQELMKQYLDKGGHADGVFGHSDLGAIGAFLEAERRGLAKQMLIVGIDGLPGTWEGVDRVKKGQFAASYVYPTQGDKVIELAINILQGKPYKKDNYLKSFLATPENCAAIALQYQESDAKVKNMKQISDHLDSYSEVSRIQRRMIVLGIVVVLALLFVICYIYNVYRKKLQKQKVVARRFVGDNHQLTADLKHLEENDCDFMNRFKNKLLANMSNADMKMDDLSAEMKLSKVQLYRKVKAMTGKTPAELLKAMRLQRAYTLLQQTDKTISEISAEVGFAVPGYFSSCFKKQFGVLPTDFRSKQTSNEE